MGDDARGNVRNRGQWLSAVWWGLVWAGVVSAFVGTYLAWQGESSYNAADLAPWVIFMILATSPTLPAIRTLADEGLWKAHRNEIAFAATMLITVWAMALLPIVLAAKAARRLWFVEPDRLTYPCSLGRLILSVDCAVLLTMALVCTVTALLLLRDRRSVPPGQAGWWRTAGATAVAGGLTAAVVFVTAEPTGAVPISHTADQVPMKTDRTRPLDLSRAYLLPPQDTSLVGTAAGLVGADAHSLIGFDPHGRQRWEIGHPGNSVDPRADVDHGRVVLGKWQATGTLTAYAADTGKQLWSTTDEDERWSEYDTKDRSFVRNDPTTGRPMWTVRYGSLGCIAEPPPGVSLVDWAEIDSGDGAAFFTCPTKADPEGEGLDPVIGGLDPATGRVLWTQRRLGSLVVRRPELEYSQLPEQIVGNVVGLHVAGERAVEMIDVRTGDHVGEYRGKSLNLLPGGYHLQHDDDARTFVIVDPNGERLWSAALPDGLVSRDWAVAGHTLLIVAGTTHDRSGAERTNDATWLFGYDLTSGHRTVIAGPSPTADGERPILTTGLGRYHNSFGFDPQPWGVLVQLRGPSEPADGNARYMAIPAH